jgi:type II secretory pathway component GspD/PulD (secretin)
MKPASILFACLLLLLRFLPAGAQDGPSPEMPVVEKITPQYLPPSRILDMLGVSSMRAVGVIEWDTPRGLGRVEVRHNDAANLLILTGTPRDLDLVKQMIAMADVPPLQIEISVEIVEISRSRASDLGIDWQRGIDALLDTDLQFRLDYDYYEDDDYSRDKDKFGYETERWSEGDTERGDFYASARLDFADVLKVLQEGGAADVRSAPRILTLNNQRATILDGSRVTYVSRYSSYSNLFATDSMDAGLTMSVLPSVCESGLITLDITAEVTTLGSSISGSPVKSGQMLENTVVVRDGESVVLGGLTRSVSDQVHRRVPGLGHVLPFLFSRRITVEDEIESYLVLTPRVVSIAAGGGTEEGP